MASTQAGPQSHFVSKRYENALNQSIEAILSSTQNSNSQNSANFVAEFQQFVQSRADPPLESIWVYAALTYTPKTEPFSRISGIKDLFQLIISCSASCTSIKSIALVAPVIYNLHSFVLDLNGSQFESNKERKKVDGEIKSLVDSILGYISVCCNGFDGDFDESECLIRPVSDLISFWLEKTNFESLRTFFPLLSEGVVNKVSSKGYGMCELAGFVAAEAFLLKLCWKIRVEGFGDKVQNELKSWIVGFVTGLRNSYFYATLLSMLLEPVLPITSLMNFEHGVNLRKLLFDSLVLVEYSFVSPESLVKVPVQHAKQVILSKLLATHEAIELFRVNRDQTKAMLYTNAFANSSLLTLIVKLIKSQIGNEFNLGEPTGSSPRAFLRWLLNIENREIKIFDDDMSEFRIAFNSKEQLSDAKESMKPNSDLLFYIDNKGEEENAGDEDEKMTENISDALTTAAHSMQSTEKGGKKGKKRRTKGGDKKNQVKFVKYKASEYSLLFGGRKSDGSDSGGDVDNQSWDENMETIK